MDMVHYSIARYLGAHAVVVGDFGEADGALHLAVAPLLMD